MKVNILYQNTDLALIEKGVKMITDRTDFFTFTFTPTNKEFTSIRDGELVYVNPVEILKESGECDIACLLFDPHNVYPYPNHPIHNNYFLNGKTPIQIPNDWFVTFPEVLAEFLLHELCHASFFLLSKQGVTIRDSVHDVDFHPEYKTHLDYFLSLIPLFTMTSVTITRTQSTPKETLGFLVAQNAGATFSCKTLELPWLENKHNISCIPTGTYQVKFTRSLKFPLGSYEVQNVPNRTGVRVHPGNFFTDIQGCILLGATTADINKDGQLDVTASRNTIKSFEGFMGRKDFTLVIK
jgi:hypothetical protein